MLIWQKSLQREQRRPGNWLRNIRGPDHARPHHPSPMPSSQHHDEIDQQQDTQDGLQNHTFPYKTKQETKEPGDLPQGERLTASLHRALLLTQLKLGNYLSFECSEFWIFSVPASKASWVKIRQIHLSFWKLTLIVCGREVGADSSVECLLGSIRHWPQAWPQLHCSWAGFAADWREDLRGNLLAPIKTGRLWWAPWGWVSTQCRGWAGSFTASQMCMQLTEVPSARR